MFGWHLYPGIDMDNKLRDILAKIGHQTEVLEQTDGGTILVLPYGGRVLGLFAAGSEENFLWTHPALQSETTARAFYSSDGWHNSGGDRTWLAPEVDFFLPHFPDLSFYFQPRALDPGSYLCAHEDDGLTLGNRSSSLLSRSGATVHLNLTKHLTLAHNPLRRASRELAGKLAYAGYAVSTQLAFTGADQAHPAIGLWSLLQMPHGGELLIPTISRSAVSIYFGEIHAQDVTIADHLIRYRMDAVGEHKLGVPVIALMGRAGYLYRSGHESCLVIRNFSVNPSGEYIDVPWHDPQSEGSAVEACNVNSSLGAFSELEYHAPAFGGPGGAVRCQDVSQVWAFRGAERDILEAGRILLSPEL